MKNLVVFIIIYIVLGYQPPYSIIKYKNLVVFIIKHIVLGYQPDLDHTP
jgi:hypothetical protein